MSWSVGLEPFCSVCREVVTNRAGQYPNLPSGTFMGIHHRTMASFQRSSGEDSCMVCSTVWRECAANRRYNIVMKARHGYITQWHMQDYDEATDNDIKYPNAVVLTIIIPRVEIRSLTGVGPVKDNLPMCSFVLVPAAEVRAHSLFDESTWSTDSATSLEIAKRWINTCKSKHIKCNENSNDKIDTEKWYPTRLLDVEAKISEELSMSALSLEADREVSLDPITGFTVRLVSTNEVGPILDKVQSENPCQEIKGSYITLSHCWGTAKFIKLTKAVLQEFHEHIDERKLPQTFQDAIKICRQLQIRYIWIDSLCIIQDSREDWEREAALMHKVYARSFCNIAATGAADSSTGIFFDRRETNLFPLNVDMNWKGSSEEWYYLLDLDFWQRHTMAPQNAPLNNRGWVVQERLLAPRVLHFGSEQLLWECREMDASEQYPQGLPVILQLDYFTGFKFMDGDFTGQKLRRIKSAHLDPKFYPYELWSRIVHTYARCLLTYPGDKLIALSGIAKMMRDLLKDEYVAGMWRKYLPSQLVWSVDDCSQVTGLPSMRSESYRAPSFSWASLEALILMPDYTDLNVLIEVLEVKICPRTDDDTGQLDSGFLRIRGCLKKLKLIWVPQFNPGQNVMVVNENVINLYQDPNSRQYSVPQVRMDLNENRYDYYGPDHYCMLVIGAAEDEKSVALGLILQHEQGTATAGHFRRVGMFQCLHRHMEMMQVEDNNESEMPCETYDKIDKHTIVII